MPNYREYHFAPDEVLEYFRKSRQDDPAQSIEEVLEKHRRIIDKWVMENLSGPVPEENVYMERVSGETIKDRAEMQKVLSRIESPEIRAVLVVEPQRLSRGDLEDAGRIINAFRYSGTVIITPQRIYDLRDESDLMFLEMELKQGNQYLEYTKKILSRGKMAAVMKGCFIAKAAPFGYEKVTVNKLKTLQFSDQVKWLRKIYELADAGHGNRYIANYLEGNGIRTPNGNAWNPETVDYILKNVVNIGKIRWNYHKAEKIMSGGTVVKRVSRQEEYVIVDGLHPAAVSEEQFNRVNSRRNNHPRVPGKKEIRNPLAGLVYCSHDGYAMIARKNASGDYHLLCKNQCHCHNGSVGLSYVIDSIANALCDEVKDFQMKLDAGIESEVTDRQEQIRNIKDQIAKLNDKEIRYWKDRYEPDGVQMPEEVFKRLTDELSESRKILSSRLEYLKSHVPEQIEYAEKIKLFSDAVNAIKDEHISISEKNEMLKKCIRRIDYRREAGKSGTSVNSIESRPYQLKIDFHVL